MKFSKVEQWKIFKKFKKDPKSKIKQQKNLKKRKNFSSITK